MQDAGRILLMPKGDYSASATYEMLDLVNHSGASWVCKKECTGQEPSDSNTEFWQRFGTAVDISNFMPLVGGGTVEADNSSPIAVKNTAGDQSFTKYEGESGTLGFVGFSEENVAFVLDKDGEEIGELIHTGNYTEYLGGGSQPGGEQTADNITGGTFGGKVVANATAVADLGESQVRNIYIGETDLEAGVSPLPTGDIYIKYK